MRDVPCLAGAAAVPDSGPKAPGIVSVDLRRWLPARRAAGPGDQYPEDAALDAAGAADAGAADAGPAEAGVVEPPGALVAPPPPCVQPAMRAAANATVARVFQMYFMARNTRTQAAAVLAMMVAWIPPTTTS